MRRGVVLFARDQKHLEVREDAVPVVPVVGHGRSTDDDRTSRKPALLFGCNVKFLDREPYRLLGGGLPLKHEAPATQTHKRDRAAKLGQERT